MEEVQANNRKIKKTLFLTQAARLHIAALLQVQLTACMIKMNNEKSKDRLLKNCKLQYNRSHSQEQQ